MNNHLDIIKKALKDRGISQKAFAETVGIASSHLSDILKGRRRITIEFAKKTEECLEIPATILLDLQIKTLSFEEEEAKSTLEKFNELISIKTLLKKLGYKFKNNIEKLKALNNYYNINSESLEKFQELYQGCFRRSSATGMDERMIRTWMFLAHKASCNLKPKGIYDRSKLSELSKIVSELLHHNTGSLLKDLEVLLSNYGIGLIRVDKINHASIDGYSFFRDNIPYIIITCRYDRIDYLAFTLLHEIGHLALGHTTPTKSQINLDFRSYDEDSHEEQEDAANQYAANCLIPEKDWMFAPTMPWNPFLIQEKYTRWSQLKGFNPWIVLGRLSYETGIYKFKSDYKRAISGGKEVSVMI